MTKEIGDRGEMLVAQILQSRGWQILATQWHCRWGELDVVVRDRLWLVFVEVKTRGDHNWDLDGSLSVNTQKQSKIIKTASEFLLKHPQLADLSCRFDVALVRRAETPMQPCIPNAKSSTDFENHSSKAPLADFYLHTYIEQAFTS